MGRPGPLIPLGRILPGDRRGSKNSPVSKIEREFHQIPQQAPVRFQLIPADTDPVSFPGFVIGRLKAVGLNALVNFL
jgi:hypothetical protein